MNAGGKKRAVGTAVDNLAWWRMSTRRQLARSHRLNQTSQDSRCAVASFELVWKMASHPDEAKILRSERLNIEAPHFARRLARRDDKFLADCRECRRKAATA